LGMAMRKSASKAMVSIDVTLLGASAKRRCPPHGRAVGRASITGGPVCGEVFSGVELRLETLAAQKRLSSAVTTIRAAVECFAYAFGYALRCTRWAAQVRQPHEPLYCTSTA